MVLGTCAIGCGYDVCRAIVPFVGADLAYRGTMPVFSHASQPTPAQSSCFWPTVRR